MNDPRVRRGSQKKQCCLSAPEQVLRALRCAKTPIYTPTGYFGSCGVQKPRSAHRQGILDRAVCRKANSHTGRGFRVVRCAERPIRKPVGDFGGGYLTRIRIFCNFVNYI